MIKMFQPLLGLHLSPPPPKDLSVFSSSIATIKKDVIKKVGTHAKKPVLSKTIFVAFISGTSIKVSVMSWFYFKINKRLQWDNSLCQLNTGLDALKFPLMRQGVVNK